MKLILFFVHSHIKIIPVAVCRLSGAFVFIIVERCFLLYLDVIAVSLDLKVNHCPNRFSLQVQGRTENSTGFIKSDVIFAGQGSGHSSYRCEHKLSLRGTLTLNAFTGTTPMSAVIRQRGMKSNTLNISFIHAFRLCW